MSIPWNDWQFWVVTGVALLALLYILREVIPIKPFRRKAKGRSASLTIEGKSPKK